MRRRCGSMRMIRKSKIIPFRDHLLGVRHPIVHELGNVDESFDAILDPRERSEVGKLRHGPANKLTDLVGGRDPAPGLSLGPLDRKCDLLFLSIDAQDVDIDFLTDSQHFAWMPDPAPGKLGEMDESVSSADVDEGAEVADRRDATLADFALAQLVDQSLLHDVSPLLHRLALGEDETVSVAIDLDHLQRQRATDQRAMSACLLASSPPRISVTCDAGTKPRTPSRFTSRPPLL